MSAYTPQFKQRHLTHPAGTQVTVGTCKQLRLLALNCLNTLRPRQNGRHFADDIFKRIFFNENIWIPIKISLKFLPKGSMNKIPALVQIMAWRRPGDKPLSEPMMVSLLTHICVTRPQWVKYNYHGGVFCLRIPDIRQMALGQRLVSLVGWTLSRAPWFESCWLSIIYVNIR